MSQIIRTILEGMTEKECIVSALKRMGYAVVDGSVSGYGKQTAEANFHIKEMRSVGFMYNESGYELVADFYNMPVTRTDFVYDLQGNYQLSELEKAIPSNWKIDTVKTTKNMIEVELAERI